MCSRALERRIFSITGSLNPWHLRIESSIASRSTIQGKLASNDANSYPTSQQPSRLAAFLQSRPRGDRSHICPSPYFAAARWPSASPGKLIRSTALRRVALRRSSALQTCCFKLEEDGSQNPVLGRFRYVYLLQRWQSYHTDKATFCLCLFDIDGFRSLTLLSRVQASLHASSNWALR